MDARALTLESLLFSKAKKNDEISPFSTFSYPPLLCFVVLQFFFLHGQNDHAGKLLRSHAVTDESAFEHAAAE